MILQWYFMKEALRAFGMIIGALMLIYLSTRFASYLGQAAEGKIAADHIFRLLGLKMVVSLKDLIPMSLYLGIFSAMIRMQRDSELTAVRAAGGGHALLIASALKLGACAAVVVAVITLYAEPRAELTLVEIRNQTENEATIAGVKAGRFKELSGGRRIFYAEKVAADERTLQNTFVQVQNTTDIGLMRKPEIDLRCFSTVSVTRACPVRSITSSRASTAMRCASKTVLRRTSRTTSTTSTRRTCSHTAARCIRPSCSGVSPRRSPPFCCRFWLYLSA
jgi:hypothetical protein